MSNELMAAIGRVRRAMPRNSDVMAICDAAERGSVTPTVQVSGHKAIPLTRDGKPLKVGDLKAGETVRFDVPPPPFNKTAYQRDYMRKRRASKAKRREKERA